MCTKSKWLLCLLAARCYDGAEVGMVASMLSRLPSMVFIVMTDVSETYTFKVLLAGAHHDLFVSNATSCFGRNVSKSSRKDKPAMPSHDMQSRRKAKPQKP